MPEEARKKLPAGVATGLAWTPTGGDVLYIETTLLPGSHELTLTGQLGDVMQESATRGPELPLVACRKHGAGYLALQTQRRAHPRAIGRHSQRRTLGRHHHGDCAGFLL